MKNIYFISNNSFNKKLFTQTNILLAIDLPYQANFQFIFVLIETFTFKFFSNLLKFFPLFKNLTNIGKIFNPKQIMADF
jgi:hypothetical protein